MQPLSGVTILLSQNVRCEAGAGMLASAPKSKCTSCSEPSFMVVLCSLHVQRSETVHRASRHKRVRALSLHIRRHAQVPTTYLTAWQFRVAGDWPAYVSPPAACVSAASPPGGAMSTAWASGRHQTLQQAATLLNCMPLPFSQHLLRLSTAPGDRTSGGCLPLYISPLHAVLT